MNSQWKLVPVEPTQSILDAMTTERKKGNGVLQMWFEAMAAAPAPPLEAEGVDFGIDGRSVRVSHEAYSIFVAREAAGREKIDALQQRLNAADQRIDELGQSKELLREAYNEASPRLPYRIRQKIEQFFDGLVGSMSQDAEVAPIKGMIEARGGKFAIMIDEANAHYGWTFRKDANGMWVSGRKATDVEMHAARTHAHITNQQ